MDLETVMSTTPSCRAYKPDPVPDVVLARVLDAARFAPSGGNRQPVRLIAVRDPAKRRQLKEWYLPPWRSYYEAAKVMASGTAPAVLEAANRFAEQLDQIPVLIVVCFRIGDVYPSDAQLGRVSVVGGASVYPAVQNVLLKARAEGLGTTLTTLLCLVEPQVKELLGIPDDFGTAAVVALGWPAKPFPKKLNRRPLSEMAYVDRFGAALPEAQ